MKLLPGRVTGAKAATPKVTATRRGSIEVDRNEVGAIRLTFVQAPAQRDYDVVITLGAGSALDLARRLQEECSK